MKKILILILMLMLIILLLLIVILSFNNKKLSNIKVNKFINQYERYIQENIDKNIKLKYPNPNSYDGIIYWIDINKDIKLGISVDNLEQKIDVYNDNIATTTLKYSLDFTNDTLVDQYLFYLIKANNSKISDKKINEIIKKLRINNNEEIQSNNLFISHFNDNNYSTDNIGRNQK